LILSLSQVSRRFPNGTQALAELSFDIAAGSFVSLLGPSGCGKSTALRIIAGLLAPDSGTIAWAGAKPELGFVFQEPTLMPWATALANVRLPLDLKNTPRAEADTRAAAALFLADAPDHAIVPLSGASNPAMMRSAVDLPQPLGPSSDTKLPSAMLKLRPDSACVPPGKRRATWDRLRITC